MKKMCSAILMGIVLISSGCAWFQSGEEKAAFELAIEGMEHYNNGRYSKSLKSFQTLRDWYPFSKYAMLAELKMGDAYYQMERYEEAISAYEEFETLHPRNEAVPYVIYQTGRCYYDRIDTVDRDQTSAQKAVDVFSRLIRQFPQTEYARRAESHRKKCLQTLAGHDYYVGMYYFKKDNYKAALKRFQTVVTQYPDAGVHYDALHQIALCETLLQQSEKPE